MKRLLLALGGLLAASAHGFDFGDITHWAGSGLNEAAIVIDWNDTMTPESIVWGYRWNGTATGEDMLRAVVASDSNLYIKVSDETAFGIALFGIGYDLDADGFALTSNETFTNRTIVTDYDGADGASASDADDHYQEGWYTGFWGYYVAESDGTLPGSGDWGFSGLGMSSRELSDGSWDGWSFASGFDGSTPDAPTPASAPVPEPFSVAGLGLGLLALKRRKR